ncbi:hypothetical protein ACFO9Q_12490 [Paenibacillus sp. GCM10023252]|uniref:hypothetical protein n=1 Tax=Paenibacillus sp. GCM10023252 TaxID=3252649 RepID=UPI003615A8C6
MMTKLRIMPILISAAAAALVLFGGWLIYHQVAVKAPLEGVVNKLPGVVSSEQPQFKPDLVTVSLLLDDNANLHDIYSRIMKEGSGSIGDRELQLDIKNKPDQRLEKMWSSILFEVAEAMETQTYSNIPAAMSQLMKDHPDVQATTDMDDSNVYITMKSQGAAKYVVLPRTPARMEAWSNA